MLAYSHVMIHGAITIFVQFGVGICKKYYNIINLSEKIGLKNCLGLPFFHAFTGCDVTSSFYNHGKCKFWDAWMMAHDKPDLTDIFIELSNTPSEINEQHMKML